MTEPDALLPAGYADFLAEVKIEVRQARVSAARALNTQLITLYWRIGRLIAIRQAQQSWGTGVINRLSADLRTEFPGVQGFSPRSLRYMRSFAAAWPEPIWQEPAAKLPWSHIMTLLDKVPDPTARVWYAAQDVAHGWSNAVLSHHIRGDRYGRAGGAPNNFLEVMDPVESDQTRELLQDPYHLEFLGLAGDHNERQLEDALVARLTQFLAELGTGFAFVGRQYKLTVGGGEYFIDLLFYHLRLRRFIVFELKAVAAQPEHIGKLNFYVNVVDDVLRDRRHGDEPTIGILLAADRDDIAVQYALHGLSTPIAVSTYRTLPDDLRPALPSGEDLAALVRDARNDLRGAAAD